jgi:phosphoribosylanthranilate isomerase
MRIKICGITNYEDAKLCCDLGADALGFIFTDKSKRKVSIDIAKTIIKKLPVFVSKIGVFVNEDLTTINRISKMIDLAGVQLHGEESPEFAKLVNLPVIKTFRINSRLIFLFSQNTMVASSYLIHIHRRSMAVPGIFLIGRLFPSNL